MTQKLQLGGQDRNKEPPPRRMPTSTRALLISVLASSIMVLVITVFVVIQFQPKPIERINWQANNPTLNSYPGATLIVTDSEATDTYKHGWRVYASKDDFAKIKQFYEDQFLGLGYKSDSSNVFPLGYSREESTRCQYVRYGLDVELLEQSSIEIQGVNLVDVKNRFPGQTIFVVQQFDTVTQDASC
jgi:hypothetical protein